MSEEIQTPRPLNSSAPLNEGFKKPEATEAKADESAQRRGRPPKIDPATGQPIERPKRTYTPRAASAKSEDDQLSDLAKQVQGIHQMAAMVTGISEAAISEQESKLLAKGLIAVSKEYGLSIDGKSGAALQLFAAASIVYLPRALQANARIKAQKLAIRERAKQEQMQRQQEQMNSETAAQFGAGSEAGVDFTPH